jgi:hypothetical protein
MGKTHTFRSDLLASEYLGIQCGTLLRYKQAVEGLGIEGAPNCTAQMLQHQLEGIFSPHIGVHGHYQEAIERHLKWSQSYLLCCPYHITTLFDEHTFPGLNKVSIDELNLVQGESHYEGMFFSLCTNILLIVW